MWTTHWNKHWRVVSPDRCSFSGQWPWAALTGATSRWQNVVTSGRGSRPNDFQGTPGRVKVLRGGLWCQGHALRVGLRPSLDTSPPAVAALQKEGAKTTPQRASRKSG
jgi:hypothetical protein